MGMFSYLGTFLFSICALDFLDPIPYTLPRLLLLALRAEPVRHLGSAAIFAYQEPGLRERQMRPAAAGLAPRMSFCVSHIKVTNKRQSATRKVEKQ